MGWGVGWVGRRVGWGCKLGWEGGTCVSPQLSESQEFKDLVVLQESRGSPGMYKTAPSPVPLQVLITESNSTFPSWKLSCNPLPSSLDHYQYLWPDESKVICLCLQCIKTCISSNQQTDSEGCPCSTTMLSLRSMSCQGYSFLQCLKQTGRHTRRSVVCISIKESRARRVHTGAMQAIQKLQTVNGLFCYERR